MTLFPVLERELRTESRHALTYVLRLCGAGVLCGIFGLFSLGARDFSDAGKELFQVFHGLLFLIIWLAGPLTTFDALSREKREGTLGLLFLTPLKAPDIVLAKAITQCLRLSCLGLASIPIMCVAFLAGGVSWRDAVTSVLINGSALLWAISAGLVTSSYSKRLGRALLGAYGMAFLYLLAFNWLISELLTTYLPNFVFHSYLRFSHSPFLLGAKITWGYLMDLTRPTPPSSLLLAFGAIGLISCCWFLLNLFMAGKTIQRTWQQRQPPPSQVWAQENLCTPVVSPSFFKRWLRRSLEANPVGWLEQRSWSGRIMKWGWLGLIVLFYSCALGSDEWFRQIGDLQAWALILLLASLGISAALSLRRERENGLLELMLVSPLKVEKIVSGRVRGLWSQFILAVGLVMIFWFYLRTVSWRSWHRPDFEFFITIPLCLGTFIALPGIGLYCSLRLKHIFSALATTYLVACIFPAMFSGLAAYFLSDSTRTLIFVGLMICTQLFLSFVCTRLLLHDLRNRRFALEKTGAG